MDNASMISEVYGALIGAYSGIVNILIASREFLEYINLDIIELEKKRDSFYGRRI